MPFAYYGAKHKLSARGVYPAPAHSTIIEPFAGSAAYACVHAASVERVVLLDRDPSVVNLWRELQDIDVDGLDTIEAQLRGRWCTHPLIAASAGGHQLAQTFAGRPVTITPWMRKSWPSVRRRIEAALPHIRTWSIECGTYHDAPDIEGTWFVDPPYQPVTTLAGDAYRFGADRIDFHELADWVLTRRGQVIVCEQLGATWLPFEPVAEQVNGSPARTTARRVRTEVMWTRAG